LDTRARRGSPGRRPRPPVWIAQIRRTVQVSPRSYSAYPRPTLPDSQRASSQTGDSWSASGLRSPIPSDGKRTSATRRSGVTLMPRLWCARCPVDRRQRRRPHRRDLVNACEPLAEFAHVPRPHRLAPRRRVFGQVRKCSDQRAVELHQRRDGSRKLPQPPRCADRLIRVCQEIWPELLPPVERVVRVLPPQPLTRRIERARSIPHSRKVSLDGDRPRRRP